MGALQDDVLCLVPDEQVVFVKGRSAVIIA